jgi:hypothetical protein
MQSRHGVLVLGLLALVGAWPTAAQAQRRVRPIFEPTDLALEESGTVEADLQTGFVRGNPAGRLVIPDVELDLGINRALELDLDGAYAIEGPDSGSFGLDHAAPDSLWLSIKTGVELWDVGFGLQLGPKFPTAKGSHGLGGEALVLVGKRLGRMQLALNAGAFIDPFIDPNSGGGRPRGLEGGVDAELELTKAWSLTAELGTVHFFSGDPAQLVGTAGVTWSATEHLDLSLVGLYGLLGDGDRYGVLFGLSPKFRIWRQ